MKKLNDFKEEIHKCSKCGLCQAVCPLYKATGNECTVSRGQFIMLDGVVKGNLKINKNINKYLDLCLKCGKCSEFCPSEIDIVQILLAAKYEYFKNSLSGKIYALFESKPIFNSLLKLISFVSNLFCRKVKSKSYDRKVIWFGGCVEKVMPQLRNYVIKLLNSMEIEVVDIDFNCCGMPFLTTGNLDRFREQVTENIEKIPENIDEIVFECASCEWAWKQYLKYVNNEFLLDKLSNLKMLNLYNLLADNDVKFIVDKKQCVTYHQPCHSCNIDVIRKIFSNCENLEYVEMKDYDKCCGFAGFEHPQTIKTIYSIMKQKIQNIKEVNVNYVITTCVGCLLSLSITTKFRYKIRRLITFLKDECKIK